MSGTSLDGVDGVLVDFSTNRPSILGHSSLPFAPALREELLALNSAGSNELHRAALAGNGLVQVYAQVVETLINAAHLKRHEVLAVGAHGQTVRHRPGEYDGIGYTLQLNQPALLAELCGIDVVADFRSRDVAAGGQGAPLVPPFHQAVFGATSQSRAVLNIGGIANITLLDPQGATPVSGFDCGPGNVLLDAWCARHSGALFDAGGQWAAGAAAHPDLLQALQTEPFFAKVPPKSTGRDLFHLAWLEKYLHHHVDITAQVVQSTLTELTAKVCAQSLLHYLPSCQALIVCGGGALNTYLMQRLQAWLPTMAVQTSKSYGIEPLHVEATAFAWLAHKAMHREPASIKTVTGAKHSRVLGAIYPA